MFSRLWRLSWVAAAALTGCATTTPLRAPNPTQGQEAVIALFEQPMSDDRQRLRDVLDPDLKQNDPRLPALLDTQKAAAEALALQAMTSAFSHSGLHAMPCGSPAPATQDPLDSATLAQLTQHCQALYALVFRITDYGLTPQAWRYGYFSFEVISSLAIAGAIIHSEVKSAHALAGAYLTQESVEEFIEGYAGLWALNEVSRPVRIEASLFQWPNPTPIWQGAVTGLSDTRLERLFRAVPDSERQDQLRQSVVNASNALKTQLGGDQAPLTDSTP